MAAKTLYTGCEVCGADGVVTRLVIDPDTHTETWTDETCTKCGGTGTYAKGSLDDDLIDLLNDILDKVNDIKEKLDEA